MLSFIAYMNITSLKALEILDSRGKPTVRTFLTLEDGSVHTASVPSGSSTGSHEALELRDGDVKRHLGQGVLKAVENVNTLIAKELINKDISSPERLDTLMLELDGTKDKSKLGANAILSVSLAAHRAAAHAERMPLWEYINQTYFIDRKPSFPRLMVNLVNGGKHAGWNFDIQEFIIIPAESTPSISTRVAAEIFQQIGKNLKKRKLSALVGDEGGYSPALSTNEEVFELIEEAAKELGYARIKDFVFAVDCAATEFYENGMYILKKTNEKRTWQELSEIYAQLGQKYTIQSFEDPFAEDDWDAWIHFTGMAEKFQFQVVGDDLLVTNPERIQMGLEKKAANAVLVKLNQIGSVKETVDAIKLARSANWHIVISHRSGETEDTFISDFAYGCGADMIKTGSMSRSERLAKYNRLLEIEQGL
jgi:enolase